MACCGAKRAKRNSTNAQASASSALPGVNGIVKVEYLGKEIVNHRGAKTGAHYRFSVKRRLGYVDRGDAGTLLELSENGNTLFRILGTFNVPQPPPEISSVIKGIGAEMVRKRTRKAKHGDSTI